MKKFCECLREHTKNRVDFEKKKVTVIKRRIKITPRCKSMIHLQKKKVLGTFAKDKNYQNTRDHCHYTGKYRSTAQHICNLNN